MNMRTMQACSHLQVPGIDSARLYPIKSQADCLSVVTRQRDASRFEGFVIADGEYRRVGNRSVYVTVHHTVGGAMNADVRGVWAVGGPRRQTEVLLIQCPGAPNTGSPHT